MSDLLAHLLTGFSVALTADNLLYALLGCLLGTAIGVLPGLGPGTTIAMLLPATYTLAPTPALIMLAGIYYGAQYGGSTTAILVNLPGETSSIVTALDGYKLARNGHAGAALAAAALSSFFAGCVGVFVLAAFAVPLTELAFKFGPAEYFSLMLFGLVGAIVLSSGPVLKAIGTTLLGLLVGLIGTDVTSGTARYSFGIPELLDGINFIVVAMGIFGYGEIISNISSKDSHNESFIKRVSGLLPSKKEIAHIIPATLRGSGIGVLLGLLPGGGAVLAAFTAYAVEKKLPCAANEVPLGEGNIRGVAAPEAANNAGAQASFMPLLTLGLPTNAVMAMMLGAMTLHDVAPGPQVMTNNPTLFWGLVASMLIGNGMLVLLNLPLIGMWVRMLSVPYNWLFPAIVVFCTIGVYASSASVVDLWLVGGFGLLGYGMRLLDIEPAPLLLGLLLGPMMEENFRRALIVSRGDWAYFLTQPISAGLLLLSVLVLALAVAPRITARRRAVFSGT